MSQQHILRTLQRNRLQPSSAIPCRILQRRFVSTEGQPKLTGAADNAFNRERQAVKAHAAATSSKFMSVLGPIKFTHSNLDLWRKLSI